MPLFVQLRTQVAEMQVRGAM